MLGLLTISGVVAVIVLFKQDWRLSKQILAVARRLRSLGVEVEAVVDEDGEIVSETSECGRYFVRRSKQELDMMKARGGLISIHNHPVEVPPSIHDIRYAAAGNFSQIMIVTPKYIYDLSRPIKGWQVIIANYTDSAKLQEMLQKMCYLSITEETSHSPG